MGQLAQMLRLPQKPQNIRRSGGTFEYGDPIPLIEDLIATRRTWPDATLLANDNTHRRMLGYLAFWEDLEPRLDFFMPMSALEDSDPQTLDLFRDGTGRTTLLSFVEREGARGFESLDGAPRTSFWSRLAEDDDLV
jgi:hypothetical protein